MLGSILKYTDDRLYRSSDLNPTLTKIGSVVRHTTSQSYNFVFQSYELSWSVDSYSPIEEYRLLYRKIKPYHGPLDSSFPLGEGDWTNVIIPGDMNNLGFTHLRSYLISGLLPESEYECLVQARNRFGWSDASRLFTFFTSTKGGR